MAVNFPVTVVVPQYPYDYQREHKTLITTFDSGKEQRRQQWRFPRRSVSLVYRALTFSQVSTLWDFYQDRVGALGSFNFTEPDVSPYNTTQNHHRDEYIARGDGVTTAFSWSGNGPSTVNCTVLINGVSQSTGWIMASGGGEDNSFLLRFTSNAPTSTMIITGEHLGRLRITCRFAEDSLSRSQFEVQLFSQGIKLIEEKRSS